MAGAYERWNPGARNAASNRRRGPRSAMEALNLRLLMRWTVPVCALFLSACGPERAPDAPAGNLAPDEVPDRAAEIRAATATVHGMRIGAADAEPGNWLAHGRTYAEEGTARLPKSTRKPWTTSFWPGSGTPAMYGASKRPRGTPGVRLRATSTPPAPPITMWKCATTKYVSERHNCIARSRSSRAKYTSTPLLFDDQAPLCGFRCSRREP